MKTNFLLFTYNRSFHTEQVINNLKENTIMPDKLIVFQDGLKQEEDPQEWNAVNCLIKSIDWCKNEVIVSDHNKGLADSIVSGINYAFEDCDAVIVLEDDCVPAPEFVKFMVQCFEQYQTDPRVYAVSGYSWPIDLTQDTFDVYGCGRISSWGWGTWKDRWKNYHTDKSILKRIKNDKNMSRYMAVWGSDYEQMLLDRVKGINDSWAVFWGLYIIEKRGICINPYKSLIQNIGLDGTGTHCGKTNRFQVEICDSSIKEFCLPGTPTILQSTEAAFVDLYGNSTAVNHYREDQEKVLVYGCGQFFRKHEKEINTHYYIEAFIDKEKQGYYAGKAIIRTKDLSRGGRYDKILIMVQSINECMKITKELVGSYKVSADKIILGCCIFGSGCDFMKSISIKEDGTWEVEYVEEQCKLHIVNGEQFYNVKEVLVDHIYDYHLTDKKSEIVFDVGMNIGDAVLYFLNRKQVQKVYGYEPFKSTFAMAEKNLRQNDICRHRYEIFQYGISSSNEKRIIQYNMDMSCAQSTSLCGWKKGFEYYEKRGLINADNSVSEEIIVRKASEVFGQIMDKETGKNFVLKMDCEGEEYDILEELFQSGILKNFKIVMCEWHYRGKEKLLDYLEGAGFSWYSCDKNRDMGLIYAYKC